LYDALIIGGGPIGSYIAKGLAAKGHSVGVLEKGSENRGKICCTGIVSKNCYQTYLKDKDLILKQGRSAKVYSPSGKLLNLNHKEDQAFIIDRNRLDSVIAADAIESGADFLHNHTVKNLEVCGNRVLVEYQNGTRVSAVEAKAVIIASGFNSGWFKQSGVKKELNFTIGAQIEVYHRDIEEIEIYIGKHLAPGFFGWLVPLDDKRALVGLMTKNSPNKYLKDFLNLLKERGKVALNGDKPAYRGITLQPPQRTYGERFIMVGDAAGQVKPLTGGGIYFGLLCADIAIKTIDRALNEDDMRAVKLATYEKEWKQKLNKEMQICRFARRVYSQLSNRQLDRLIDISNTFGIADEIAASDELDFDFHSRVIRKATTLPTVSKLLWRRIAA
jgi:geranylgeranyl reductase family protein